MIFIVFLTLSILTMTFYFIHLIFTFIFYLIASFFILSFRLHDDEHALFG